MTPPRYSYFEWASRQREKPAFYLNGWDDEKVYVNLVCECGAYTTHGPLDENGRCDCRCVCGRRYVVTVSMQEVSP